MLAKSCANPTLTYWSCGPTSGPRARTPNLICPHSVSSAALTALITLARLPTTPTDHLTELSHPLYVTQQAGLLFVASKAVVPGHQNLAPVGPGGPVLLTGSAVPLARKAPMA